MIAYATSAIGWTCAGSNPPIRIGGNLLVFGQVSAAAGPIPRLSLGSTAPFDHWDYNGEGLIANATATGTKPPTDPFSLADYGIADEPNPDGTFNPPLFVSYLSDDAFWVRFAIPSTVAGASLDLFKQHEILLFARDPHEQTDSEIQSIQRIGSSCSPSSACDLSNQSAAASALAFDPHADPFSAGFVYPPSANFNGPSAVNSTSVPNPVVFEPIRPGIFFPGYPQQASGPGLEPNGRSSVKAAEIINRGLCEKEIRYATHVQGSPGLLERVVDQLPGSIAAKILQSDCHANIDTFASGWTFVDTTTDVEDRQIGGFFLSYFEDDSGFLGFGPRSGIVAQIALQLFDGRLTSTGEVVASASTGKGGDQLVNGVTAALTGPISAPVYSGDSPSTLAESIFQASDELQSYAGSYGSSADPLVHGEACDPSADDSVGFDPATMKPAQCTDFIKAFHDVLTTDIATAAPFLSQLGNPGTTISPADEAQIFQTKLLETTLSPSGNLVLRNFRCAKRDNPALDPGKGQCEYIVRAKRLNVLPDAIQLVFVDDYSDFSQDAYPLFVHLLATEINGELAPDKNPLCDPPRTQNLTQLSRRSFVGAASGAQHWDCADSCSEFSADSCAHPEEH